MVVIICATSSFAFSSNISFRTLSYHIAHPLELLRIEQENPFYKILTIFKTGELSDNLKHYPK